MGEEVAIMAEEEEAVVIMEVAAAAGAVTGTQVAMAGRV